MVAVHNGVRAGRHEANVVHGLHIPAGLRPDWLGNRAHHHNLHTGGRRRQSRPELQDLTARQGSSWCWVEYSVRIGFGRDNGLRAEPNIHLQLFSSSLCLKTGFARSDHNSFTTLLNFNYYHITLVDQELFDYFCH